MSNYQKNTVSGVPRSTSFTRKYNPRAVNSLQTQNKSALDIINKYTQKVQKGQWISSEERELYKNAIGTYKSTSNQLRGISESYNGRYSIEEMESWKSSLSSLDQMYNSVNDFYKQFGDENQYKGWQEVENQYNQYNSVLNNGNFNDYYNAGVGVANPNQSDLFWNKYNRDSVGNMVTLAESGVLDKAFNDGDMDISDTGDIDANGSALLNLAGLITTYMTEDEKKTYNYYIGSGDKAKAEEYLDWLVENKLKPRQAGRISENTNGNIGELLIAFQSGMHSGMQGINNAYQAIFNTGNLSSTSSTQLAAAYNKQDNSGVWKVVNDLAETTGNMTPSLLVGILNPTAGAITMGVSSGGNAYATMINEGYKPWQALLYGGLVGTSEALLGEALGGITKLGGGKGVVQKTLSKIMPSVNSAALRVVGQVGAKAASEFTEEALQTVLDPFLKHIATGGAADIDSASLEEIFYSGFLGALSAGVLEGPSTIANGVSINQRAQKAYGGDASTIVADALNVDPKNKTAQMAQTRLDKGKNVSGLALNEIVNSTDQSKINNAVKSRLEAVGETGDITKLADAITKKVMGEELSLKEKNLIKSSQYGNRVLNELNPGNIISDQYSTAWAEGIGTRAVNPEVYNLRTPSTQTSTSTNTTTATQTTSAQSKSGGVVVDTAEGKTTINKVNSDSTVELANGKTVNASDVKIADTNADLVFKTATERIGQTYTNESATAMIKGYESSGVMSAPEFIKAWDEAYNLGKNNELTKGLKDIINSGVSEQAAFAAYELGKNSVLQTQANSGIINTEQSSEVINEGEDTYLRNGGEWNGSANSQGQISTVEGSTGQNQSGTETRRFADSEAARLVNEGREVSVADLGILGGAKNYKVRLLDGVQETTLMKKGREYAENRGLKVKYFAGNNLFIYDKSGKLIEANGYISNGYIFVRADHDKFTSNQILRHEVGHDMVAKGEINIDKVRQKIKERFKTEKEVDQVAEYYAEAYHMAFSTQEEVDAIWEEIICDSLADMNVFSGSKTWAEAAEHMGMTIPAVQKAVSEGKANQTRGSPDKSLSKSRDTKGGWGKKFGTAQEALNDAIQSVDTKLWNAFDKELDSNTTNHPITNAINAVMHDVRQDKITPMQGAMLLSQTYKDGGVDALSKLYNHKTGNLFDNVLERAKQIGEGKASREIEAMENNRYSRLTKFRDNLPNVWFAYSYDYFYVYTNYSFSDYKVIKKIKINDTNSQLIDAIERRLRDDINGDTGTFDRWVKSFQSRKRLNNGNNVDASRGRTTGAVNGLDDSKPEGKSTNNSSKSNRDSELNGKASRELGSNGNELTKEQAKYFKDSKVRDDKGNLLVVYHGSANKFTEFKHSKIGVHGTSLGRGFYFTEDTNLASSYYQESGQLLQGYLDIKKPLVDGAKTISKTDVTKLIKAICESEAKYLVENDGSYDNVNDAIKDTFISNYVNTYNTPMANAYREMAEQVYRYNDSDADIIGELINGGAGAARVLGEVRKALGYDGVIFKHPDGVHEFVAFESNQFKNIDNKNPTSNPDIRFSRELELEDYDAENEVKVMSNRELLVSSLESTAQNEAEKEKLAEYKGRIDMLNAEEKKLAQLKSELKELTFGKGAKDPARAKALREEIVKTENRINLHDKKLLQLESTKSLKDVLEREKTRAYKRAAEKGREALHRNVEGRHKTAERNRIRDIAHELDTLLNKGTKKKNVKIGQQDVISKVLDVTDMLFATDDELILNGIKTQVTSAEQSAIDKYKKLYAEYHDTDNAVTEHKEERKAIRHEMDEIKKQFADVLERERQRISNLKASSAFDALIEEYKKLASSDKTYIRDTFDTDTLQMLEQLKEDVGDTTVSKMTLEQLQTIRKALTMMKKMVQNTNKLFKSAKNETIEALGSKAQSEIEKHGHKDKLNKLQKGYASFDWNNLKPIYLLERTDSSVLQELGQAIFDAESDWASDMLEARIFWDKMEAKYNATKWNLDKSYTFTNATGQTYSLTLEQIMSVYAYSKRGKQAIDHLKTDGFVFDETTEVKGKGGLKYELNDKTAYKITEPNLIEIVNKLTPEQKSYVDDMQKYLSEVMGAKGNEVSRELYGIDLFGEENYFPIRSEGAYLERVRQQAKGETKIKNKGFTKETQKGARNAIVLSDFSKVWSEHVAEMSSYHTFTLPLEDFYRVYNYQTTSDENINKQGVIPALENAYGKAATSAIDQLLSDLNGGERSDPREAGAANMLRKFKIAKTMLSLSVVVQQPTSILRAQAMIDPKYFVGEKIGDTKRKELWNELKQYAPVAIIKEMGYFDVGMGRSSADWLTATDYQGWGKVKGFFTDSEYRAEVFSKPASKADEITWVTIWNAVKRETARNNPALNTSSETFLNMAGKRFEDIIRHTQVYDSTLSRSSNMRSKKLFMQMATSFMAEPTTSINMREMAMRSKDKNRILRTTAAVYSAVLFNSLLVALPYAMRDDDEDETFLEKYVTAFADSLISGINPVTSLPFVKDIWSMFQGYDIERADMSLVSDLIEGLKKLAKASYNREGYGEAIVSLLGDLSAFTGIPIDNIIRDAKSVINAGKTIMADKDRDTTWNSIADQLEEVLKSNTPVWGWFPRETKSKKLYDALVDGDNKYVARFRSTYKTEEEYYSAVRKSLRDNDPRMREAAQAYLDKNYTVYNQLRDEIVAEGVFNKTLVTDALKAEINYLKRKAEEAEE